MLLLPLSPWSRRRFPVHGFRLPRGAQAPAPNEIVLLAERGWRRRRHRVRFAARVRSVRVPQRIRWPGASEWVVRSLSMWPLETPFTLEGIQITPLEYFELPRPIRLDPMDADEVVRRLLLRAGATVRFSPEPMTPDDMALSAAFHRLWSKSAWNANYVKQEWREFARMLEERGVRT